MGGHPLLEVCSLQESCDLERRDRNPVGRVTSLSDGQEHLSADHLAFRPGMHGEEDTVRPIRWRAGAWLRPPGAAGEQTPPCHSLSVRLPEQACGVAIDRVTCPVRQPGRVEPCRVRRPCVGERASSAPATEAPDQLLANPSNWRDPSEGPAGGAGGRPRPGRLGRPGPRQSAHRARRRRPPPRRPRHQPRRAIGARPLRRPLTRGGGARPRQPRPARRDGHDRRGEAPRAPRRGHRSTPRPWRRCSRRSRRPSRRRADRPRRHPRAARRGRRPSPATSGSSATIASSAATPGARPTSTGSSTARRSRSSSPTRPTTSRSSRDRTTPSPRASPRSAPRAGPRSRRSTPRASTTAAST